MKTDKMILFSKVYESKVPRKNSSVESIPLSFSKALSEVTDLALRDIHQVIAEQFKDKKK